MSRKHNDLRSGLTSQKEIADSVQFDISQMLLGWEIETLEQSGRNTK